MAFKYSLLFGLFFGLIFSVKAQVRLPPEQAKALKGTWVKTSVDRDTLVFKMQKGLEHHFLLKPERSINPPRYPQGVYSFAVNQDSISLQWLYSSVAPVGKPKAYFKLDAQKNILLIGNFYNAPGEGRYLRFQKIETPKKPVLVPETGR